MIRQNPSSVIMTPAITEDPRWARLMARDKSADGLFWYSVATTGIYCRPSCPARRPAPDHVTFHDTLADAQASGCRPCKRCRPDDMDDDAHKDALVEQACRSMEQAETGLSLAELAREAGLSPAYFHRLFKARTGLTPKAYAAAHRAGKLREHLGKTDSVTEAIYEAGFNSSGRFYEQAEELLGMTPARYRKGGEQEELRFAVGHSSLGYVLVASSAKGVVAILMGDEPDALVRDVRGRFPKAMLRKGDADYEQVVAQVIAFVDAPHIGLGLALDIRGTLFQQRVWQALRGIAAGETASYAEIARRIGAPTATRAVAGACAANPIAVAVPCHRVVRGDGALSGYRWGIERKRCLLAREAENRARKR